MYKGSYNYGREEKGRHMQGDKETRKSISWICLLLFSKPCVEARSTYVSCRKILLKTKNKKQEKGKSYLTKFKNQRRISLAMLQK